MRTVLMFMSVAVLATGHTLTQNDPVSPAQGLAKLQAGNLRFVKEIPERPNQTKLRRKETAKGQNPFAAILTCADSRVVPEIIFDQGLGDLFTLSVAGNTSDEKMVGSIEYAVANLGSTLVVVMGHSKCGAVEAAIKGGEYPGSIPDVVQPIETAVEQASELKGDKLLNTTLRNVKNTVNSIRNSSQMLSELESTNKLMIVGAYYDVKRGTARIFQVPPGG